MTNTDLCGCGKDHKAEVDNAMNALLKGDMTEFKAAIKAARAKEAKVLDYRFTDEQVERLSDDLYDGAVVGGQIALKRLILSLVPAVRAVAKIRALAAGPERSPAAEAQVLTDIKRMDKELTEVFEVIIDTAKPLVDYYFPEVSTVRT